MAAEGLSGTLLYLDPFWLKTTPSHNSLCGNAMLCKWRRHWCVKRASWPRIRIFILLFRLSSVLFCWNLLQNNEDFSTLPYWGRIFSYQILFHNSLALIWCQVCLGARRNGWVQALWLKLRDGFVRGSDRMSKGWPLWMSDSEVYRTEPVKKK